jgi:hypothetical protein
MSESDCSTRGEVPSVLSGEVFSSEVGIVGSHPVKNFLQLLKRSSKDKPFVLWEMDISSSLDNIAVRLSSSRRATVKDFVLPGFAEIGLRSLMGIPEILITYEILLISSPIPVPSDMRLPGVSL